MDRTSPEREYNKAVTQLIIISFFGAFGGVLFWFGIFGYNHFDFSKLDAVIATGIGAVLIMTSGIPFVSVLKAMKLAKGGYEPPPSPPQPPRNDASDTLNFSASHTPATARIEVTRGNTILLGGHHPDNGTWGNLGDVLEKHNWRFSRDIIADSFVRITERYPEIQKDFRHLKFIQGKGANQYVTRIGQRFFIEQSPNLFLEHMRVRK